MVWICSLSRVIFIVATINHKPQQIPDDLMKVKLLYRMLPLILIMRIYLIVLYLWLLTINVTMFIFKKYSSIYSCFHKHNQRQLAHKKERTQWSIEPQSYLLDRNNSALVSSNNSAILLLIVEDSLHYFFVYFTTYE